MKSNVKYVEKQVIIALVILLLTIGLFILGLVLGYGVIGHSDNPWNILSLNKWSALVDKLTGRSLLIGK